MEQASRTWDASNPHDKAEKGQGRSDADIQPVEIEGQDEREKDRDAGSAVDPSTEKHQRFYPKNLTVLSFRRLQLQRISELQDDLLRLAVEIASEKVPGDKIPGDKKKEVDEKLGAYSKALRNYETLSKGAVPFIPPETGLIGAMKEGAVDPLERQPRIFGFRIPPAIFSSILFSPSYGRNLRKRFGESSSHTLSHAIGSLSGKPPESISKETEDLAAGYWGYCGLDEHLRDQNQALSSRLNMAAFGGAAFYMPMLIMTLNPSTLKGLLTILVSTIVFGFLLAISATDSTGKDVLAATAAYAGVLVVFAGSLPIPSTLQKAGGDLLGGFVPELTLLADQELSKNIRIQVAILSRTALGPRIEQDPKVARTLDRRSKEAASSIPDEHKHPTSYGFFASIPNLLDIKEAIEELAYSLDTPKVDIIILSSATDTTTTT